MFDDTEPKYFLAHSNLKWVKTSTKKVDNVEGAIKVFYTDNDPDYVARFNLTDGTKSYQQIGYYWERKLCYWHGDKFIRRVGQFEILACSP